MTLATLAKAYFACTLFFLAIDALFLGVVAKSFFVSQIGGLMREQPRLLVAAMFYIFFCAGLVYFAVIPALDQGSLWRALINGAFLGALAYGTYEVTNYATLKDWPLAMMPVDIVWGSALSGASAVVGYLTVH